MNINMTEIEVLPPAPIVHVESRDPITGKFAKGHTLRKKGDPSLRIKKKLDSKAILEAIHDVFTPDEIADILREARQLATAQGEWKGLLEIARFVAAYAIGKPVQRSIKATIEPEDFIALFKGGSDDEEVVENE